MKQRSSAENVIAVFRAAHADEVGHGRAWHDAARFAARVVSVLGRCSIEQAAGVLAALSPLNRWENNVADAISVARDAGARVRCTAPNRWKAIRILAGEPAKRVLRGRKVISFWRQIVDPDHAGSLAIDRHLWRAAIGQWVDKQDAAPENGTAYDLAELAFLRAAWILGESPLVVASTCWLVMRRGSRDQRGLPWS